MTYKVNKLIFTHDNAKLGKTIYTFSLLAGHSCPFADKCLSKVIKTSSGLRIKDGVNTEFRCYAASSEAVFTSAYNAHKHNFDLVRHKSQKKLINLIYNSLPNKANIIRIHQSGDFFNQDYFDAWLTIAQNSDKIFYAYTKSLPYWVKRINNIPPNFRLTASFGGKYDSLINEYNLRSAKVVFSLEEAQALNLEIDHDDSLAIYGKKNFALLIHGIQPKGSKASKAREKINRIGDYTRC